MSAERLKQLTFDCENSPQLVWVIDKITWSCLFIAGFYLTVEMFLSVVQQYRDTTTDAAIMVNRTMKLPPAALCMPIIIKSELLNGKLHSDVQRFFDRGDLNKAEFLGALAWPDYIILAATNYLVAVKSIESILQKSYLDTEDIYRPDISLWETTHTFLLRVNITSFELKLKYGEEVRRQENITFQFKTSRKDNEYDIKYRAISLEQTPLSIRFISCVGTTDTKLSICWQFPLDKYEFHANELNIFRLTVNREMILKKVFFLTFQSGNVYKYTAEIQLSPNNPGKQTATLAYDTIYKYLPVVNGNIRCQTDEPAPAVCMSDCRTTNLWQRCFDLVRLHNNFSSENGLNNTHLNPVGTFQSYNACLQLLNLGEVEDGCRAQCLPYCSISVYNLAVTTDIVNQPGSDSACELDIDIKSFVYLSTQERFLYTFESFIAAVGGVFSFWLGLDATFFISLIFVPTLWLIGYCSRTTSDQQLSRNHSSSNDDTMNYSTITANSFYLIGLTKLLKIDVTGLTRTSLIKKIVEKLFWIVIYLLGSILTIIMGMRFYWTYRDTPISTIFFKTSAYQMLFPSATMCLPLFQSELGAPTSISNHDLIYLALEHYDNVHYEDVAVKRAFAAFFKYDYQRINEISMTKNSLLAKNQSWSVELLRVARQYLILFGSFAFMENADLRATWQSEYTVWEMYNWKAIDLLAQKMHQLSINYDQLLEKFGMELQRFLSIEIMKYESINQSLVGRSLVVEKTAFLTDKSICYRLPTENLTLDSLMEYFSIKVYRHLLGDSLRRTKAISIRMPGRSTDFWIGKLHELSIEVPIGTRLKTALKVAKRLSLQPVVDNSARCTKEITLDECFAKCRISDIEKQCNCTWLAEDGLDEGKILLGNP